MEQQVRLMFFGLPGRVVDRSDGFPLAADLSSHFTLTRFMVHQIHEKGR